jgi:pimeloyl-ACP methyl ester carboxylesterase
MTSSQTPTIARAVSRDGTQIAYWTSGMGRPLLLVHGGLGDHTRWDPLRPHLEPHFTVHAMDRRGRGGSGDQPEYDIEREYEDVAAVVDAIAAEAGVPVDVNCSSYGGLCAFGAATLTSKIGRLALYEAWPPVNLGTFAPPEGFIEQLEGLLTSGQPEQALIEMYRQVVGLSDEEIGTLRTQPAWPSRVAASHTFLREMKAFQRTRFDRGQAARITVPTLLLVGSESPAWRPEAETVTAALPDARIVELRGQAHVADLLAPAVIAEVLLGFFR